MIKAIAAFAVPSKVRLPGVSLLILIAPAVPVHPVESTYHNGSPLPSVSLSWPSVLQGSRPTAGRVHDDAATPSLAVPAYAGFSGHGNLPGVMLLEDAACEIT
jgi:hypothetical protein